MSQRGVTRSPRALPPPLAIAPLAIAVAGLVLASRAPAATWPVVVGDDGEDHIAGLLETAAGDVVAWGSTSSPSDARESAARVVTLDAAGNPLWQTLVGGVTSDGIVRVVELPGGDLLAVGTAGAEPATSEPGSALILRLDSSGRIAWQQIYEASTPVDAALLGDGSIAILSVDNLHATVWRVTPDGAPISALGLDAGWNWGFNATDGSLCAMPDGGSALAISYVSDPTIDPPFSGTQIVRIDPTGLVGWCQETSFSNAPSLAPVPGGGLACFDGHQLARLDDAGRLTSQSGILEGWIPSPSIHAVADGFLLGGNTVDAGPQPPTHGLVVRTDLAGTPLWARRIGVERGWVTDVTASASGDVLVAGSTAGRGITGGDGLVVRLTATGDLDMPCDDVEVLPLPPAPAWTPTQAPCSGWVAVPPPAASAAGLGVAQGPVAGQSACGTCASDLHEMDDACGAGLARLRDGGIQEHDFCDDPRDWTSFEAVAGRTYTLATSALGGLADTVLELHAQDCGGLLGMDDDGGGGRASRLTWTAIEDAVLHVLVRQSDGGWGPDRAYTLTLTSDAMACDEWMIYQQAGRMAGTEWSRVAPRWSGRAAPDGGHVVAGGSVVAKLDHRGEVEWARTASRGPGTPEIRAAAPASDGGACTTIARFLERRQRAGAARMDTSGSILWSREVTSATRGVLLDSLHETPDGGMLLAGYVDGWPIVNVPVHGALVRLDPAGNLLWSRWLENAHAVVVAPQGTSSIVACAGVNLPVMRLAADGSVEWAMRTSYPFSAGGRVSVAASATSIAIVSEGNVAFMLDDTGALVWSRTLEWPGRRAHCQSIAATPDGGWVIAASLDPAEQVLVKLDAGGALEWDATAPGSGGAVVWSTLDGRIIASGSGVTGNGMWSARFDPITGLADACVPPAAGGLTVTDAGLTASWATIAEPPNDLVAEPLATDLAPVVVVTSDACSCRDGGLTAPLEVSGPRSSIPLRVHGAGLLTWEPRVLSGSATFNVYRGSIASLHAGGDAECLLSRLLVSSANDPESPRGGGWYYLVTGVNAHGESTAGSDTLGRTRAVSPCP